MKFLFPGALLAALLLMHPRLQGRWCGRLRVAALLVALLLCWMPTAWLLNYSLESPYLAPFHPGNADADAVVVFSGGVWPPSDRQPYPVPLNDTVLRSRHAAWVQTAADLPIVLCGGPFTYAPDAPPAARLMRDLARLWGVPAERITLEDQGRSTYEQGVNAARILRELDARRVIVVTEAFHMRRASGVLEKQGFEVEQAACGLRSFPDEVRAGHFLPGSRALQLTNEALREWAAITYYRLLDRI